MLLLDLLASGGVGIAIFDSDLRLLLCNASYGEFFGLPEVLMRCGRSYIEILRHNAAQGEYGPDPDVRIRQELDAARPESPTRAEWTRPNGTVLSVRRSPVPGGGFIDIYTDITARKNAEQEAGRRAEMLQATIDNMADGVRVFDKDFRLVAWNRQAFAMLGFPDELARTGTPYSAFVDFNSRHEGLQNRPDESMEDKLVRAANAIDVRGEHLTPAGRVVMKRRRVMPGGGFVSTYFDITERRRAEEALERKAEELTAAIEQRDRAQADMAAAKERAELANRAKSEFLANMSHELRTPLNAIIGFAEMMQAEVVGPIGERYRDYARNIRDSGAHLLAIITDILDLAKIEAGKMMLDEAVVSVADLIESCITLVRNRAELAGISLAGVTQENVPRIWADERKLKQILINVISNAVKFTPSGGRVTVVATLREGDLVLSVTDTGIGIAPEDIPKALAPFTQLDNGLTRRYDGTGLGLGLAQSLARLHNGTLAIESAVGEGTTVTLTLPAHRVLAAAM
jgi:PAS domain S-box-containing protein